ncbi:hypothetical protein Tco_0895878 [Tanacetum coccineum]|uniref:Secreted protein n=1 Tax=Tanacetum coccineum TaxID=301880 RepID=A0ABQ5CFU9_9ASTR
MSTISRVISLLHFQTSLALILPSLTGQSWRSLTLLSDDLNQSLIQSGSSFMGLALGSGSTPELMCFLRVYDTGMLTPDVTMRYGPFYGCVSFRNELLVLSYTAFPFPTTSCSLGVASDTGSLIVT